MRLETRNLLSSKMLYGLTPDQVDWMRHCMKPLIRDLQLLESGRVLIWHQELQQEVRLFCRLAYTIGDSLASNEMNGFLMPGSNRPCRLCELHRNEFHNVLHVVDHFAAGHQFPLRKEEQYRDVITQAFHLMDTNGISQGEKMLHDLSLSPLSWRHVLRDRLIYNPCTQSPPDVMHLDILNLWKFHIKRCLWPTLQAEQQLAIHENIVAARAIFGIVSLRKGVVSFTSWNAHEWVALSYFILPAAIGVIPAAALILLGRHSRLLRLLAQTQMSKEDVELLGNEYPAVMRDLQQRYQQLQWNFPSYHTGMHWTYYIHKFGTPVHYSGMRWEAVHQFFKRRKELISGRADMLHQFTDSFLKMSELMQYDDYRARIKTVHHMQLAAPMHVYADVMLLNNEIPHLLSRLYSVPTNDVASRVETFRSVVLHGKRFRIGQDVRMQVRHGTWWLARIEHVIRHEQRLSDSPELQEFIHLVVLWYDVSRHGMTHLESVRPHQKDPRDVINVRELQIYRVTVHTHLGNNRFLLMDSAAAHRDFLLSNE